MADPGNEKKKKNDSIVSKGYMDYKITCIGA